MHRRNAGCMIIPTPTTGNFAPLCLTTSFELQLRPGTRFSPARRGLAKPLDLGLTPVLLFVILQETDGV